MRFSVIIPNYNYDRYLRASIESALALDWPNKEVIVVDDGSTDRSRQIIRSFGDRVISIFQANSSQRVAYNVGFARSTGGAIIFLDSDDVVDKSLAREVAKVWRPRLSKVQVQMSRIDTEGRFLNSVFPLYNPMPTPEKIVAWATQTSSYPTPPGSGNIYARDFLHKIFPLDNSCGDAGDSACIVAAPFLGDIETIKLPLVSYRLHGDNHSNMLRDDASFARAIMLAKARYEYSLRFHSPPLSNIDRPGECPIYKSLEVLQYRIASLKLSPKTHPLEDDSWSRILLDAFRVPWCFPAATRKLRIMLSLWAIMTLLAPKGFARRLILLRSRSRVRPRA